MEKEELKKYVSIALFIVIVVMTFLIIKPFVLSIITAFILAYLIRPIEKMLSRTMPKKLSAALAVFIIVIIILLPIAAITAGIVSQALQAISSVEFKAFLSQVSNSALFQNLNINAGALTDKGIQFLASSFGAITITIAEKIVGLFIIVLSMFYILVSWDSLAAKAKKYIPFRNKEKVSKEISDITDSLIYGTFFVAIIEFIIAAVGLWLAGIEAFWLLATIVGISAFIPALGPGLVWVPALIYKIFQGEYVSAIILLAMGLIISVYIDTFVRANITGKKAKVHPFIILIGIFGGVALFGLVGFIIGPLILSYTLKLLEEFWEN